MSLFKNYNIILLFNLDIIILYIFDDILIYLNIMDIIFMIRNHSDFSVQIWLLRLYMVPK